MALLTRKDLEDAVELIRPTVPPTPQYAWPLLCEQTDCEVWVKHENHTPTGAFKIRGGLVFLDRLKRETPELAGLVTATRGNHGQSIAQAAKKSGVPCTIVVPEGNSVEKNRAMQGLGAELIVAGADFDESRIHAAQLSAEHGFVMVPSFHSDLVKGVATYAFELFTAQPDLDAVYVPVGMGSGICGVISVRDLLGLKTKIIGVVAENAPAMWQSFEAGEPLPGKSAATFADGLACREPNAEALAIIKAGADRIMKVSEDEIAAAIRILYATTHNVAEGAAAAPLAALLKEGALMKGKRIGLILSGGNIDTNILVQVLTNRTPQI